MTDQTQPQDIRPSPIAGTWYPGDAEDLAASIDKLLNDVKPKDIDGQIIGLIVPHAGHRYSGSVAAQAFRLIAGMQPEVVVVVTPLHAPASEAVLTSDHQAYATPLGTIEIDRGLLDQLDALLVREHELSLGRLRNDREHALEIELPFIQRCLDPGFSLVPIMLHEQSGRVGRAVGEALAVLLKGRTALLVASSDLSHFYPQSRAMQLDQEILKRLANFDPAGIIEAEELGLGFACGRGAMAAVLWAAKDLGATGVKVLGHATSGDVTGDNESVVGYGSAVIVR